MKMSGFRFALGVSVCLLTVWVPATSMAGNVSASAYQMSQGEDEAWTFYRTGQYGKALAAFRGLETKGDVAALYGLGVMATNGLGMPRNDEKALVWFREGAAKGSREAQFGLGAMYDLSRGVRQDMTLAIDWYEKSARAGYAPALTRLGRMNLLGGGCPAIMGRRSGFSNSRHSVGIGTVSFISG